MKTKSIPARFAASVIALLLAADAFAQTTRLDLQVVESPAFDGQRFGQTGQYEHLRGMAYGEVDPTDPRHREIVNLDKAPRNESGRVEYRATVEIYRPIDMTRWNQTIYHTVSNRGGAGAAEPALLERGFAFVRVGWQGDLSPTEENIAAFLPVAKHPDGSSIVGTAVEERIFNDAETVSRARLTYATASLDPTEARLTVRATQEARRSTPADLRWSFLSETEIQIDRAAGFDGGAIYEFVYRAKDPIVMGLGFAAIRDAISFLRS